VVLSRGALLAQGEFHGESVRTEDGCYGPRRLLPSSTRPGDHDRPGHSARDATRPPSGVTCTTPRRTGATGPCTWPASRRATRSSSVTEAGEDGERRRGAGSRHLMPARVRVNLVGNPGPSGGLGWSGGCCLVAR
jgi:hypothetical protein